MSPDDPIDGKYTIDTATGSVKGPDGTLLSRAKLREIAMRKKVR